MAMRFVCCLVIGLLFSHGPNHAVRSAQPPIQQVCTPATAGPKASGIVRVPIEISNNHVFVAVCAADRPLQFLLDTGAPESFMDLSVAISMGAELKDPFEVRGAGAGSTSGASMRSRRLSLAGTQVTVDVGSALDLTRFTPREGRPIEGILGYDFLKLYVFAIDYRNQELHLHNPRAFRYEGPGVSVPIVFNANKPNVDAAVKLADGEVLTGRFVVDVGSALALSLVKPFVEKHRLLERTGPTVRRPGGGGVGGPSQATIGRVAALVIGTVEITSPVTHMFGDGAGVLSNNPHWIGNIGGDILRRFTVYFDYERKRMILEPNADRDEPFESDMSGATVIAGNKPNELLVDSVVPGSAAAEAGLERGDVILEVGTQPVRPGSLLDLRARMRRAGETVTLTVLRQGSRHAITFTTRRIV